MHRDPTLRAMHVSLSPHWPRRSAPAKHAKDKKWEGQSQISLSLGPPALVSHISSRTVETLCVLIGSLPGKSSHCEPLAQATGLKHLSVNQVVKDKSCHDGYDDERKSWIVDEDKVFFFLPQPAPFLLEC